MKELNLKNVKFSEYDSLIGGVLPSVTFDTVMDPNEKFLSAPSGTTFEMAVVSDDENLRFDGDEVKEIINEINTTNEHFVAGSKDNYEILYLTRK